MWAWFSAGGVVLVIVGGLLIWGIRALKRSGRQEAKDEQIKESAKVAADQRDIAARPPRHRRELLDRMRDGKL